MKKHETEKPNKNTITRYNRTKFLLKDVTGMAPQSCWKISRDYHDGPDSICNDDRKHFWMTISAFTHIVNRRMPDMSLSWICNGNTRNSFYFPLHIINKTVPDFIISGQFYQISKELYRKHGLSSYLGKRQKKIEDENFNRIRGLSGSKLIREEQNIIFNLYKLMQGLYV